MKKVKIPLKYLVSVVIPITKNDPHVDKCVEYIERSTYSNYEIIIVDEGLERSKQRNIGVQRSKGDYVLILDSDMVIHPNLIEECMELCREEYYDLSLSTGQYDGLYIPEIILGEGFWIRVRDFERSFYDGTRVDAVRFFKRRFWFPFDETLTGAEDWDWDRKFKGRKGITHYSLGHNEGKFSFKKYFQKKKYYSQWLDIYKNRYPNCPELNPFYRFFWVFMEKGKWKRSLRSPLYFTATIVLKMLIGIAYLCARKY